MRLLLALVLSAAACSRPHDERDRPAPAHEPAPPPRDASPDAPLAWIVDALALGGPGLCAVFKDSSGLVIRRDTNGRVIETLEMSESHGAEPLERTSFEYDTAGRLTRASRRGAADHTYDATTELFRDKTGRVVRKRVQHATPSVLGGDVNITYQWTGKAVPRVEVRIPPPIREDFTDAIGYAQPFHGTLREEHYHDGSLAPEPSNRYVKRFDERGRLVENESLGYADTAGGYKLTWNEANELVSFTSAMSVVQYTWRDGKVTSMRDVESGTDRYVDELQYDGAGRLVAWVRYASAPHERVTKTALDGGVLATTSVVEDARSPLWRQTYAYDCGRVP